MSKDGGFSLEDCKKKCDNTPECKFFTIDEKSCRTHKKCDKKEADKLRTIYKKIEGKLPKKIEF